MRHAAIAALLLPACCYLPAPSPRASTAPAPAPIITPPTPGRTCAFDVVASFPDTKPDGRDWDVAGGAPDPYVIVRQDGVELGRTAQAQDQYDVTFTLAVACDHARPMTVDLVDRDVASDDPGATYGVAPGADFAMPVSPGGIVAMITVARR